jgi:hypothetical protein
MAPGRTGQRSDQRRFLRIRDWKWSPLFSPAMVTRLKEQTSNDSATISRLRASVRKEKNLFGS